MENLSKKWYSLAKEAQFQHPYPYYIAVCREGRFKGQYPEGIQYIPQLKRQWDRGGLGSGSRMIEIKDASPSRILLQVRQKGFDPKEAEYYVVDSPQSHRRKLHYQDIARLSP